MSTIGKRIIAAGCVSIMLIASAAIVVQNKNDIIFEKENEADRIEKESYQEALAKGHDCIFWYEDETYTSFLEQAAEAYYEESGKVIKVQFRDSLEFLKDIYQASIVGEDYPDLYLLSGEQLEEACLLGLARSSSLSGLYQGSVAENAVKASTFHGKMVGYPLSYNVCLFAYSNEYFGTAPETLQAVIDYSNENEPPESVKYLLEWDVEDPFYDFPFISNAVFFKELETEGMKIHYDETLYTEEMDFLKNSLESFSLDAETVSEETVILDLQEGTTLCAIVDTDSLQKLKDIDYSFIRLPKLNDALESVSCALTDLVIVNDFSEHTEDAEKFAQYVTLELSDELLTKTGHYPVKKTKHCDALEQLAYETYEAAILAPNSRDALEFWVSLKEKVAECFE